MKLGGRNNDSILKLEVASLIDVVFLLLIYFMVTASLVRKEADLSFKLPVPGPVTIDTPMEVFIEIQPDGDVYLEGMRFSASNVQLEDLSVQLEELKYVAVAQGSEFYVNLLPYDKTRHGRIIDVMDACAAAGVENLGFSKSI